MQRIVLFCFFYIGVVNAAIAPYFWMSFPENPPTTMFYGETLKIRVVMHWKIGRPGISWGGSLMTSPIGSYVDYFGDCLSLMSQINFRRSYVCYMNIVIVGDSPSKVVSGVLNYNACLICNRNTHETLDYQSPYFSVKVLPHPLSMLPIPIQAATGNQNFVFNLKTAVKFYDENILAGKPAQGLITPISQDGLYFDAASFSIRGKPTRLGRYVFTVAAQNEYSKAQAVPLNIEVQANPADRPVFKSHYSVPSALPKQPYRMNLMELIESQPGFMNTNQISFRLVSDVNNPDWLNIDKYDSTVLVGVVPENLAGQDIEVKLIASSNTGGDSEPAVIKIPVAFDPALKPEINYFELKFQADTHISQDLAFHVNTRGGDANLKIMLDHIEPPARWLSMSSVNPTRLEGTIPPEAIGELYRLTFRANTSAGGSSEVLTIPLHVAINPLFTPRFKAANPSLGLVQPLQAYFYDFQANKDIYPDFDDVPYEISFADEFEHPPWLRIKDNRLIADLVPDIDESFIRIYIKIKNKPGGESPALALTLEVNN